MDSTVILAASVGIVVAILLCVAVVLVLRWSNRSTTTGFSALPTETSLPSGSSDLNTEVYQCLAAGKKIEAIKRVRQRTGIGLKEAKEYVERLEAGQSASVPTLPTPPTFGDDLDTAIREMLNKDQAIHAIKLVRERTGMGLKEAKDYVDAVRISRS